MFARPVFDLGGLAKFGERLLELSESAPTEPADGRTARPAAIPTALEPEPAGPIRIKLLGKYWPGHDGEGWAARFPGGRPVWGRCHFTFDRHARDYDWLVVYNDMPSRKGERHTRWEEELACSREHTLFITYEPSTIKVYGNRFLEQFRWVLTSQEPWVVRHPGAIFQQPGFIWYYAFSQPRGSYDAIRAHAPLAKTQEISAICSNKGQRNTLHRRRRDFVLALKARLPAVELFGRGIRFIEDKADALDPFKYHVAIENFYGPHHWTEKLADPFLGACLPVYYGCPNAEEYFPPESLLRIDLDHVEAAAALLEQAVRDNWYERRRSAILESRRRVLEQYAPVAQIARIVEERHRPEAPPPPPGESILSRHLFRRRSLGNWLDFAAERTRVSFRHRFGPKPGAAYTNDG